MTKYFPVEVVEQDDNFKKASIGVKSVAGAIKTLEIKSDKDEQKGIKIGVRIKEGEKFLKEKQDYFIGGAQETVKRIKGLFKPNFDLLKDCKAKLNSKMRDYQNYLEEQKQIADEKRAKELEAQQKKMEKAIKKGKPPIEFVPQAEVIELHKTKSNKAGSVTYRDIWKYEILDETMIPREYMKVDTAKIESVKTSGIEIPGVRFYKEKSPSYK